MKKVKFFIVGAVTIALCSFYFQPNNINQIVMSNVEAITDPETTTNSGNAQAVDMYIHDYLNPEKNTYNNRAYDYFYKNGEIVYNNANGIPLCGKDGYTTNDYDRDENGNILKCWELIHI